MVSRSPPKSKVTVACQVYNACSDIYESRMRLDDDVYLIECWKRRSTTWRCVKSGCPARVVTNYPHISPVYIQATHGDHDHPIFKICDLPLPNHKTAGINMTARVPVEVASGPPHTPTGEPERKRQRLADNTEILRRSRSRSVQFFDLASQDNSAAASPSTTESKFQEVSTGVFGKEEPTRYTQKNPFYPARLGEVLSDNRYVVLRKLGSGNFSVSYLVFDKADRSFAVTKILQAGSDEMSLVEIKLHDRVNKQLAKRGANRPSPLVVRMLDSFRIREHHVIVMEPLGCTLLDILSQSPSGIGLSSIRRCTQQMMTALQFLHNDVGIVHTDLKPENILINVSVAALRAGVADVKKKRYTGLIAANLPESMTHPVDAAKLDEIYDGILDGVINGHDSAALDQGPPTSYSLSSKATGRIREDAEAREIVTRHLLREDVVFKLIDFGNAMNKRDKASNICGTVEYRPPESTLGFPIRPVADIWAAGCTIYELATNNVLFGINPPHNDVHYVQGSDYHESNASLAAIDRVLPFAEHGFNPLTMPLDEQRQAFFDANGAIIYDEAWGYDVKAPATILDRLLEFGYPNPEAVEFARFIEKMLVLQYETRPTAATVLKQPWMKSNSDY